MLMLIVQNNIGQGYERIMMILETRLSIWKDTMMIQKYFIGTQEIIHSAFSFS